MERDSLFNSNLFKVFHFNSHAHVERDVFMDNLHKKSTHFNSHAHVERDIGIGINAAIIYISTHTLTWSVTLRDSITANNVFVISTHTLTWSVTLDVVYIWCLLNVMRTYFFI